mmetsp:Transcript_28298/g.68844  ORF Transcript_28298/g.68844 Transcript_28298/m.68844 type:complete len:192 (-) Transcript_28298:65-640(-)
MNRAPNYVNAESSDSNLRTFIGYGNHKTVYEDVTKTKSTIEKDVLRHYLLAANPALFPYIRDAHCTPLGLVDACHDYRNPRLIFDANPPCISNSHGSQRFYFQRNQARNLFPNIIEVQASTPAEPDSIHQGVVTPDGSRKSPTNDHHVDDCLYADVAKFLEQTIAASVLALYIPLGFPNPNRGLYLVGEIC